MKYSTLFIIMSLVVLVFPWTGLPFGFIRLVITLTGFLLVFFAIGLYQKEQKIAAWVRDIRSVQSSQDKESQEIPVQVPMSETIRTHRKKLSDVL